jgi:polyisoprenyl-phosphate glycosyltransferase
MRSTGDSSSGERRPPPKLGIVAPCFNEEAVIGITITRLAGHLRDLAQAGTIDPRSFVLFVDDGSSDDTWRFIADGHARDSSVKGLRLSRNFGQQAALAAGLSWCSGRCDCAISIDADLQQDEGAISEFVSAYRQGNEVVYGLREDRASDTVVKAWAARAFYAFLRMQGVPVIPNHADYRLMSAKALEVLGRFTEGNLFLRGIVVQEIGLKSCRISFKVRERASGATKYSFWKMVAFALDGITSFSVVPLRVVFAMGAVFTGFSALMACYVMVQALVLGHGVPGWASTVLPIYVLGGVQLISIGIIGEYVGRIYHEVKRRPRYIVEDELTD